MTLKVKRSSAYVPNANKMTLKSTAAGGDFATKLWNPRMLGDLVEAWWEADAGITFSSGRISDWNDQKNSHHFNQPTAGLRPIIEDSVFGSAKAIRFTAANTERLALTGAAKISGLTSTHVFVVLKLVSDPTTGINDGLWKFGSSTSSRFPFSGDNIIYDDFATNNRKTTIDPTPSMTLAHCYEVISTSSEWSNRLDGSQLYTTTTNTVAWNANVQAIGADGDGIVVPAFFLDGWVGALIICSSKLRGSNLFHMRNYLNRKYGVTFT